MGLGGDKWIAKIYLMLSNLNMKITIFLSKLSHNINRGNTSFR